MDDQLRKFLEQLPDAVVREVIEHVVHGLMAGIAAEIVEAIIARLADRPAPAPAPATVDRVAEVAAVRPRQDAVERTCTECGRVGFRRFVQLDGDRWQCSERDACERRRTAARPAPFKASTPHAHPAAKPVSARNGQLPPPISARCQDCTRVWNLTGLPLQAAVDTHETKNPGHIVNVFIEVDAELDAEADA